MKIGRLCYLILLLSSPDLAWGQRLADDPRVASALELLEVWVDAQLAYEQIPGISMAVVHDQELVWSRGFGYADLETQRPTTASTIYSICSISKLFTSIGVMQLRDQGKLRLDDPAAKHLPWFDIELTYADAPPITIEGLLTHSSGLPREADFPYWTGPEFPFPTRQAIIERVPTQETLYPAETYFQYSNLGLTLAGEIVAAASGTPYAEYIRRNILERLGLESTTTEIPGEQRGKRLATGYTRRLRDGTRRAVPPYSIRGIAPAAGFTSTVEDLARFASWQFRLLESGGHEVLSANTLREMHRVHWLDPDWETTWGLGFAVWRDDAKTFVGHGGFCPGYQSHLLISARDEIATIFMTNGIGVSSRMYAQRAYHIVAPAIAAALDAPDEGVAPNAELKEYAGRYERFLGGEAHVLVKGDGLNLVYLPTDDPLGSLVELRHTGEHRFRRVRDDGTLGEEISFELGPDGQVTSLWRHSNYLKRAR